MHVRRIDLVSVAYDIQAGTEITQKPCPGIVIASDKLVVKLNAGHKQIPPAFIFFHTVRQRVELV